MRSVSTSHIHTEAEAMADMMQLKTKRMNEKSRLLSFKHTTCTRKHSHGYQQRTGHLRIITHTLQWANPQPHSEFKSKWQLSTQNCSSYGGHTRLVTKASQSPCPTLKAATKTCLASKQLWMWVKAVVASFTKHRVSMNSYHIKLRALNQLLWSFDEGTHCLQFNLLQ